MPYVIETWDKPDSLELRMSVRPMHIEFLKANTAKLLGAGAKLSDDGFRPVAGRVHRHRRGDGAGRREGRIQGGVGRPLCREVGRTRG